MPIKYTVEEDDQEKLAEENKAARIQDDDDLAAHLPKVATAVGVLPPDVGVKLGQPTRKDSAEEDEEDVQEEEDTGCG